MDRLDDTPRTFPVALDLGSHTGQVAEALIARTGIEFVLSSDLSERMARLAAERGIAALVADEEALPFRPASCDLVLSALSLHWVNDLPGTLVQIRNTLKPDGLFLGAMFGAGTLQELRTSLIEAETELTGGVAPRVSPLPGLQDVAGLMQRTGFALPVVDLDTVEVSYAAPQRLLADLGGMGERAAFFGGARPLRRDVLALAVDLYKARYAGPDGRVRATFEIIHLAGWAPGPDQPQPKRRGSGQISLATVFSSPKPDTRS
ncbi:MAG: methyltransferase domain-containing protein [Pseudomonadota bacterium]